MILKVLGSKWDKLGAQERRPYHELNRLDVQRYNQEMKEFRQTDYYKFLCDGRTSYKSKRAPIEDEESSGPESCQPPMKTSAFMYFMAKEAKIGRQQGLKMVEITKEGSKMWNLMTEEEKAPFNELAEKDK